MIFFSLESDMTGALEGIVGWMMWWGLTHREEYKSMRWSTHVVAAVGEDKEGNLMNP